MRLIDADALIRTARFLTLRDGKEIEIHYVEAERIDSAPTIDAIPVSFIEGKMVYIDKVFLKVLDRLEGPGAYQKLLHEYNALRDLIRAWKERQDDEAH